MQNAATSSAHHGSELPREALGGFRLVRKLGTGGMASVYLGHRTGPTGASQFAAIKVMLPQLVTEEASIEMFFDEARITSSIHHPYVCRVLDFGIDDGLPYLALEYVSGETLADLVEALHATPEGKLAARSLIAQVVAQACEGLHAAHEACDDSGKHLAIVHRDMAPQNILVGYDGYVRLLDFGIARAAEKLHQTQTGVLKGRFAYMAPEQMEGRFMDRRADIWSLGVMLWEGMTGDRLFRRATIQDTARSVVADPLPSLLRNDAVPPAVLEVIERSVTRDITSRFATARKMGIELSKCATTGAPQVASWMHRLFGQRLEAKRRELRDAAGADRVTPSLIPSLPRPFSWPQRTQSGICFAPNASRSSDAPTLTDQETARRRRFLRPALALLIAGGVTVSLLAIDAAIGSGEGAAPVAAARDQDKAPGQEPASVAARASTVARARAQDSEQVLSTGSVIVRAEGGIASVEVDGSSIGVTPTRVALAPGPHLIRLVRTDGSLPVIAPIEVEAGRSYTLEIPPE
jgi:serine/threonine-protein kinase